MRAALSGAQCQRGGTAIEFAIVSAVFFSLLIGCMELGRVLFYWNTATEATRLGARMAIVCDKNAATIKTRMREMLNLVPESMISIVYKPDACDINTCQTVTVSISPGVTVSTVMPFVPLAVTLPSFSTTLPRESMSSASGANPVCS